MRWWPIFILVTCFVFFLPNYKEYEEPELLLLDDGCLIYSLHYKLAVQAKELLSDNLWSKVLAIHFYGKVGHAVNVFHYQNYTYVYDPNIGTYPLYERLIYDPLELAEIIYPKIQIKKAYFLEPTFLLHYQTQTLQYDTDAFRIY